MISPDDRMMLEAAFDTLWPLLLLSSYAMAYLMIIQIEDLEARFKFQRDMMESNLSFYRAMAGVCGKDEDPSVRL